MVHEPREASTRSSMTHWQGGSVYATTVNTYDVRDQVTRVRQYAGSEGSGTYQDTTMDHDGFGRLKTKHTPEQDAGTSTTWDYNTDDTIQKVTDARGASANYAYNGRHQVTGITYAAPSGITPTSDVSFGYDAAGNRTSMTDGLGSVSYTYNSLSRLTSETRTFTDPANPSINGVAKTLSYDYTLVGGLKYIIDPGGGRIDYAHDQSGELNGVTGSGTLYAGVSNYVSGIQYRASGAVKSMTYGNGRTLALQYNTRLQVTRYEVPGITGAEFEYVTPNGGYNDNDGRVKFVRDLMTTNSKFDRAYKYDHAGRLTQAVSGPAARGEADVDLRPFWQSYGYDQWDNTTARTGKHWSQASSLSATIDPATNRNQAWGYDANGSAISQGGVQNTYDAAGQVVQVFDIQERGDLAVPLTLAPGYDGDSQRIKHVENGTKKYLLRSSALDGQVVTELGDTGQFLRGYVYALGSVLAKQESGAVTWLHRNPVTGNENRTDAAGLTAWPRTELDPLGVEVGTFDWYQLSQRPPRDSETINPRYSEPIRLDLGCTLDGTIADCDLAMRLFNNGSAVPCPNNDCSLRRADVLVTYSSGRKQRYSGLINPFLLPAGVTLTFTGVRARLANAVFDYQMPNFRAGIISALAYGDSYVERPSGAYYFASQKKPKYPPVTPDEVNIVYGGQQFDFVRDDIVDEIVDIQTRACFEGAVSSAEEQVSAGDRVKY